MHEVSMMCSVIEMVEELCFKEGMKSVGEITLHIGKLTCVEESALKFAFEAMKKDELLSKAILKIKSIEGKAYCENCKNDYRIDFNKRNCPVCNNFSNTIISGEEILLYKIEGE